MEAGTIQRKGQEGSRWVNERPDGEAVAKWFQENVTLHDESLSHEDYVQGLTLIQQEAKEKEVVGWKDDGAPLIDERKNLYYVPYAKVETRVKYFWDFVKAIDAVGFIEPVAPPKPSETLPEGFYKLVVPDAQNKQVIYVCCTMRATIYEKDSVEMEPVVNRRTGDVHYVRTGKIIMQGAPGSKMVATLARFGPDNFSLMKAETGAVGRCLGLLGMLVVPGSGVATAEDVQEAQAVEGGPTQAAPATAGEQAPLTDDDDALRRRITALIDDLGKLDKPRLDRFRKWVKDDRNISGLKEATSPQLRGLVRKLEQEIEDANKAKADAEEDGDGDGDK